MVEAPPDFAGLHVNSDFQALYSHEDSAVYQLIEQLKHELLTQVGMTEKQRIHNQGFLAGMLEVQRRVERMHERIREHKPSVPTHRQEPRAELRFLPRRFQGTVRTFPGISRAAQKG